MSGTIDWNPDDALVFARVVTEGSFTKAARALDLPKSTVSRRVARLEEQLGVDLLRRTTRRVDLTDAGRGFYPRIAAAAEALTEAEHAATAMLDVPRGRLRVSAPADIGAGTFEHALGFCQAFPEVQLDIELTNRYVNLIEEGFDVALRGGRAPDGSLTGRFLLEPAIHLVAGPDYLARRGTPRRARDMAKHDAIVFPSWTTGSAWRLTGPRGEVDVPFRERLRSNSLDGIREAARAGLGITLLPSGHYAADVAEGRLVRVLPRLSKTGPGLWLVYARSRFMSAKVRAFVDYMLEAIRG